VFDPDYTTPPGACVLETCHARGLTTAELARRMGIPNSYMQMIVHGQCPLTGDVAQKLGEHLGVPRDFWEAREDQHQRRTLKRRFGLTCTARRRC
jgi:plasmid maintenance system antidote protein VapI